MEDAIKPPRLLSLIFDLALGFLALIGTLVLLVLGSGNASRESNPLFMLLALPLLALLLFMSYRVFLILTTRYLLTLLF